jgi:hypothetical protein
VALLEGSFMTYVGQHPSNPGQSLRGLYVQIDIHRKLAVMAMLTPVERA